MNSSLFIAAVIAASGIGQTIPKETTDKQQQFFQRWWDTEFEWQFDELPLAAAVEETRAPYSGYIYPDTQGGTVNALYKYDRAFNRGTPATSHERRDTSLTEATTQYVRPFGFGRFRGMGRSVTVHRVPHWYGHCNGWTSAAIRHAEPRVSVRRNGVVFTPADIKALLAEIYIYNDHDVLADEEPINPGTLHAILGNWLGRGNHPLGMEADPGREKWNYPIYEYEAKAYNRTSRGVDVELRVTFAMNSRVEYQESPRLPHVKYFNYHLNLDRDGKIDGGYYFYGSSQIDMLWVPLSPKDPGKEGNERGNPYVNIDTVLAIWRDSVTEDVVRDWKIIDPVRSDEELLAVDPPAGGSQVDDSPSVADASTAAPDTTASADVRRAAETAPSTASSEPAVAAEPAPASDAVASTEEPPANGLPGLPEQPQPTESASASTVADLPSDTSAPTLASDEPETADAARDADLVESNPEPPAAVDELLSMRKWSDITGTYEVEARLIAILEKEAWMIKSNGKTCRVEIEKLSEEGQELVRQAKEKHGTGRIAT